MATKLTKAQQAEIKANPWRPVSVQAADGATTYYLIEESSLHHLQGLAVEQDAASRQRLQALIAEGDNSPAVPAEEAEARIRAYAEKLNSGPV